MFTYDHKDQLYESYNQDSTCCHQCSTGCCAGMKSVFSKIKSYFTCKKRKPRNKNLNSRLLLGDDY